jgi:hypothetical protein
MIHITDEPNTTYSPINEISENLLNSIPKKVYAWLDRLEIEDRHAGQVGDLMWDFTSDVQSICYGTPDSGSIHVQLWWEGDPLEPYNIRTNSIMLEDIPANIEFFTAAEALIYGAMEELEE